MAIREYEVTLKGDQPLLMHADNIEWAGEMERWRAEPANRKVSIAGDDRSPAWRWLGSCYHDGEALAIPAENIQRALMEGGALVPVPGAKGSKTFKAQSQSGMMPVETHWRLKTNNQEVPWGKLYELREEPAFGLHIARARDLGFRLFVKRARIGQSKHVRVRPRFDNWQASGTIRVWDDQITRGVLEQIVENAGRYRGLGDWRPGSKTPGPFGMFTAVVRGS